MLRTRWRLSFLKWPGGGVIAVEGARCCALGAGCGAGMVVALGYLRSRVQDNAPSVRVAAAQWQNRRFHRACRLADSPPVARSRGVKMHSRQ